MARTPHGTPATARSLPLDRRSWLRHAASVGLAVTAGGLLSACGSGDVVSALSPGRFVVFGDGLSDLGQGGNRYTVNDGTVNIWAQQLANRYGKTVTSQAQGGLGFAQGHGPSASLPRNLEEQVSAFLTGQTFQAQDVVLINLPMADVLAAAASVKAGTQTEAAALSQMDAVGKAHVATVRRLIAAGAKYIVVLGVYDLGKSPWAVQQNQAGFMSAAVLRLNDAFKVEAVNLGSNLLYVDAAFLVNRNADNKSGPTYGFIYATNPVCTTPTALTCTNTTVVDTNFNQYLFADAIHLTPNGNRQLGDYAFDQLRARW